jgi:hypothetical protein
MIIPNAKRKNHDKIQYYVIEKKNSRKRSCLQLKVSRRSKKKKKTYKRRKKHQHL